MASGLALILTSGALFGTGIPLIVKGARRTRAHSVALSLRPGYVAVEATW